MTERAPLPVCVDTPERGRVLAIVPHSDDDVIGCGGTLCKHVEQGDAVRVVVAFDGRKGDVDGRFDPDRYVATRRREALAAGAHLGLTDYEFWDYPEGHMPAPDELAAAAGHIAERVAEFGPDIVYAPWIGEHHIDHHTLGLGVKQALQDLAFAGKAWGFEVWTPLVPTLIVDITSVFERKRAALREHATQVEAISGMLHRALAITAQRAMYLSDEALHGEGFAPLA